MRHTIDQMKVYCRQAAMWATKHKVPHRMLILAIPDPKGNWMYLSFDPSDPKQMAKALGGFINLVPEQGTESIITKVPKQIAARQSGERVIIVVAPCDGLDNFGKAPQGAVSVEIDYFSCRFVGQEIIQ